MLVLETSVLGRVGSTPSSPTITQEKYMTLGDVVAVVENEGFDYAFRYYSNFTDVKDVEFHLLRKAYVEAAQRLADYLEIEE